MVPAHTKETIGEGRFLRLVSVGGWEFAERPNTAGIVVIVAITPDQRILFVEQYRPAVAATVLELPAGLVGDQPDDRGETPYAAAQRELEEETGYRCERLVPLATGPPSPGATSEVHALFGAVGLTRVGAGGGDGDENIVVHDVALETAEMWLNAQQEAGILVDPKVYAGLYFAMRLVNEIPVRNDIGQVKTGHNAVGAVR